MAEGARILSWFGVAKIGLQFGVAGLELRVWSCDSSRGGRPNAAGRNWRKQAEAGGLARTIPENCNGAPARAAEKLGGRGGHPRTQEAALPTAPLPLKKPKP